MTSRLWNFTPHALHIYCGEATQPIVIPSDGELRLVTDPGPGTSLAYVHPLHYFRDDTEAAISVVPAQRFVGIDAHSPGYALFEKLKDTDNYIVSMPVAQFLARTSHPGRIFSPATGPATVVRFGDEDPARKGQIKGVKALEYHEKIFY